MQGNSIWISKDTVVAKPGDTISEELASLLQRLGITPKEIKIKIKAAYEGGLVHPGEELALDLDLYRNQFLEAYHSALKIGVEIAWPVPEIVELALKKAYLHALTLAAEAGFITPENAEYVLTRAIAKAMALASVVAEKAPELGLEVKQIKPAAPAEEEKEEEAKEEEEEKEELTEEDLASGLGALFG